MKAEKYCGLCGQKIEIEYEPRQPVRVICPNCNAETDDTFCLSALRNDNDIKGKEPTEYTDRYVCAERRSVAIKN